MPSFPCWNPNTIKNKGWYPGSRVQSTTLKAQIGAKKRFGKKMGRISILTVPFRWWSLDRRLISLIKWTSTPERFLEEWIEIGVLISWNKLINPRENMEFITKMSTSPIEQDHKPYIYRKCIFKETSSESLDIRIVGKWKGKTNKAVTSCLVTFFPASSTPSCSCSRCR